MAGQAAIVGRLAVKELTPKFQTALRYAKVELRPPSMAELAEIPKGFQKLAHSFSSGAYKKLTVKTALRYAKVELRHPSMAELAEIPKGFQKLAHSFSSGAYKKLTVKQAGVNVLVGMEVAMWFFVGECIGKRSLFGYYVPAK